MSVPAGREHAAREPNEAGGRSPWLASGPAHGLRQRGLRQRGFDSRDQIGGRFLLLELREPRRDAAGQVARFGGLREGARELFGGGPRR